MTLVLDASVALSWMIPDEQGFHGDKLLDRIRSESAVVPSIWPLEVANGALVAERRQRLTQQESSNLLRSLSELPISIDVESAAMPMTTIVALARVHSLSAYDASYVELAVRTGFALATLDTRLASAAKRAGIALAD